MPNDIFDENTAFTATLSATDPDSTVFTYTLTNDPTGGAFQVVGDHMLPPGDPCGRPRARPPAPRRHRLE